MHAIMDALVQIALGFAILAALVPFGLWAIAFAKRRRGYALAASSLLLLFGVNVQVSPPPPPRIEVVERDEEAAPYDEPK